LKITDKNNTLHNDSLTRKEQEFVNRGRELNRLRGAFCYHDFPELSKCSFRQMILKLRRKGMIITVDKSNPCYYKIKGENIGRERKDITHEGMGVGTNMQYIINEASGQIPSLHDVKIKFSSTQLYKNAIKLGKTKNKQNGGIFEKNILITNEITTSIAIYPKTVTVELTSTYYPIICDIIGAQKLIEILTFIKFYLFEKYRAKDIPDPLEWIATHYHLNQDGQTEFIDKEFHRTISDITGGFIRVYAKKFSDGTCRMRTERIFTPNVSIKEQVEDMVNVGNYLHSEKNDISNILPSQMLTLNKFASIVAKMSSMYNPTQSGFFSL
jgi:hypothetical protein